MFAALLCGTGPAAASEAFDETQKIVKPRLLTQRGQVISARTRKLVKRRLLPSQTQNDTLSASIAPLGAVVSAAAMQETDSALWGASIETTVTHIDSDEAGASFNGPQVVLGTGLDITLSDRILIGVLFDYDHSSMRTNIGGSGFAPGRFKTHGAGVSPYLGIALSDVILLDASIAYNWGDNDIRDQISTASFDSESWTAAANVSAYLTSGDWTLAPSVGVSYSVNRDDAYADSIGFTFPEQKIYVGVFNFGATLSYTLVLDGGIVVEPSIGVQGSWEFEVFGKPSLEFGSAVSSLNDESVDLTVSAGLDFTLSDSIGVSLTGTVGGITKDQYIELSGGALVSAQF